MMFCSCDAIGSVNGSAAKAVCWHPCRTHNLFLSAKEWNSPLAACTAYAEGQALTKAMIWLLYYYLLCDMLIEMIHHGVDVFTVQAMAKFGHAPVGSLF